MKTLSERKAFTVLYVICFPSNQKKTINYYSLRKQQAINN